jgi:2-dehydro-3-deoxygluconokinase
MSGPLILEPDRCRWDLLAVGEVMLRFDPADSRISTAREFRVWEGGGEYNVARGLHRCFGMRTGLVTALADNPVGRLIEDLIRQGGVEPAMLRWVPYDGVGHTVRNGLNFVERGFGLRGPLGMSDRGHTAISQLTTGDIDWEALFAGGVRWFHCGGIFAALSETTAAVAAEGMQCARKHGAIVSYDLNYRPSLWQSSGGSARAIQVNRSLVDCADVLFGNAQAFPVALGMAAETDAHESHRELLQDVLEDFPELQIVATTLRHDRSATRNDWGAVCATRDSFHVGPAFPDLEILDRIGGGDSFASGFIYGMLSGADTDRALAYGLAHGALAMTTPGDSSMATVAEVERVVAGGTARVQR